MNAEQTIVLRHALPAGLDPVLISDEPLLTPGEPGYDKLVQLQAQMEYARSRAATFLEHYKRLYSMAIDLGHDFDVVTTAIAQEAEDRSWCAEYDEFAAEVNQRTRQFNLPQREHQYNVRVTFEATLTVNGSANHDDIHNGISNAVCYALDDDGRILDELPDGSSFKVNSIEHLRFTKVSD